VYGLLLEKLPFLALALGSAAVTFAVQRAGGALGPLDHISAGARVANAFHAAATYVGKTLWPSGLCVFYPHPAVMPGGGTPWTAGVWIALGFLLVLTGAALFLRRRAPAAAVGWLWFLGMLVPVAGLVQVGLQTRADRYTYLPAIGLCVALVWSLDALARTGAARRALLGTAGVALAALALASARQIDTWRDTRTVFERALAVDERNFVAHVELGNEAERNGELEAAAAHFARALELRPSLAEVRVNLARVRHGQGRPEDAREELERALAAEPELVEAHADLGWLLAAELGRDAEGIPHLRRAVELRPADPALRNNLAWVLATSLDHAAPAEALVLAERLCAETGHAQPGFLETLAAALARLGRFEEAARFQAQALASPRVPAALRETLARRLELYRAGKPCVRAH
jgi:tetratricopeptide (TPR) repeat protein